MIKSTPILFDIDYTLINTSLLKELTEADNYQLVGIGKLAYGDLIRYYAATLRTSIEFSPREFLIFLENKLNRRINKKRFLDHYFKNKTNFQKSLYPETAKVLGRLKKKYFLGIFSEGVKEFQLAKLRLSGLIKYFKPELIFIYADKTNQTQEIIRKFGKIYIVDDKLNHIRLLSKVNGVFPIWINREQKSTPNFPSKVKIILSLQELQSQLC